ncbi:MAG: RHS repeat-associated core domain-containing protein [Salibacteraceae bacterium]
MIYGDGYLLVRYRGVGRIPAHPQADIDGVWNTNGTWGYVDHGTVASYPSTCKVTVAAHEGNAMNYGATMQFVEEGKRNTNITYSDGTLKPRQSLSQLSSQDELVVGSTVYDYYGRPAIGVMGSPVGETDLGYIENLNMLNATTPYDRSVFHSDTAMLDDCGPKAALPMDPNASVGASKYYSEQNPNQAGAEAFVPEANGYTFSQVHYTNDATGRIRRAGGVGPEHQLDANGHYTEVIFDMPGDDEVDELLGSEAADVVNYTKVITKDVHGQISVAILDNMGRTVISYLEGAAPEGLEAIEGNGPETLIEVDLVGLTSDDASLTDQGILQVEKKISVTDPNQIYTFNYDFTGKQFTECLPPGICFDCIYEIEFRVTPAEGEFNPLCPLTDGTDTIASTWTHTVGSIVDFDMTCSTPFKYSDEHPDTFTLKFPRFGEYYVKKTLKVAQAPIEYYWDAFVEHADENCLIPYSEFLSNAMMDIDFGDCYNGSPCELNFYYTFGTWEEYSLETGETDEAVYDAMKAEYIEDCQNQPICAQMRPLMLADVSPGGQYGDISGASGLSVFNAADPMAYSWRDVDFYELDGVTLAKTVNVMGDTVEVNHLSISLAEFHVLWKGHWAEALLGAHPEYETYRFCELYSNVFDYSLDFQLTETYAEALAAGYLTPVDPSAYSGCFGGAPAPLTLEDPLVTLINGILMDTLNNHEYPYDDSYVGYGSNKYYQACQYLLGVSGGNTLYEVASAMTDGAPFGTSTCDVDAHWVAFRDMYLARRNILLQVVMEGRAMNYSPCVQCIDYTAPDCVGSCDDYASRSKYFMVYDQVMPYPLIQILTDPDPAIMDDLEGEATGDIEEYCNSVCASLADVWMADLAGCVPDGETWEPGQFTYDNVRADLITVCQGGCNADYPFPSQYHSLPPDPTLASFEAVIINWLGAETVACNHYLIHNPSPAAPTPVVPALDACACDKLLHAPDEASFEMLYDFVPLNFCGDRAACADIAGVALAGTYMPGSINWTPPQLIELEATTTATDYGCNGDGCIDCSELQTAITAFLTEFPTATVEDHPVMFTSFVNEFYGTGFDYFSLMEFQKICDSLAGGGIVTEGLSPEAAELIGFLNLQIPGGFNSSMTGAQDHPYLTFPSLLNYTVHAEMGDGGHFTFSGAPSWDSLSWGFTILGNNELVCPQHNFSITPETMGGYPNIIDLFDNLITFETIYVTPADMAAPGYQFHVNGLVNDPAGGDPLTIAFIIESACIDAVGELDKLCGNIVPYAEDDCADALILTAEMNADAAYGQYLEKAKAEFIANYIETCKAVDETYNYNYLANKYHYTLAYYDRAGNLVKTVPPKGVVFLDAADVAEVQSFRAGTGGAAHFNNHTFVTHYTFNAMNQLTETVTPDGGSTKFWYDHLGRLVVSQNARQAELTTNVVEGDPMGSGYATQAWSYHLFDDLGRPIENGEFVQPTPLTYAMAKDPTDLENWLFQNASATPGMGRYRNQVTRINYSTPSSAAVLDAFGTAGQGDTRNRISWMATVTDYVYMEAGWVLPEPDYLSHYAYDHHGNIRSHLQENPELSADGRQFFQTDYTYDLLSGLPHRADYQQGKVDQYSHRYTYDADNRLIETHTSKDGHIWDRDAHYEYRLDGKLARTELGDLQVQGCDYAYTLQGWIKGLNSTVLDPEKDMGKDGRQFSGSMSALSSKVAQDAFAFTVDYFGGDYQSIDDAVENQFLATTAGDYQSDLKPLYNGNIAGVTTALMDLDEQLLDVSATTYQYDQLHRFKESHVHTAADITALNSLINATRQNLTAGGSHTLGDYEVHVDYDPNSNITHLDRRAYDQAPVTNLMDEFTYHYPSTNNRLHQVEDAVVGTTYNDIQAGQGVGNYVYHADGSLRTDVQEEIGYLEWYPNGKLKQVHRASGSTRADLYFEYDATGNRVLKVEMPRDGSGDFLPEAQWNKTWYSMAANGVPMAIYQKTETQPQLHRTEATIYGSKRHGLDTRSANIADDLFLYSFDAFAEDDLCGAAGTWFMDETPGTTFDLRDVDLDGQTDLTVTNTTTSNFRVMQTVQTVPGETYTVNYEVVAQTVPMVRSQAKGCSVGGATLGSLNTGVPSAYNYTFVANDDKSQIIWRGMSGTGSFTIGQVSITGPGDVYDLENAPKFFHRIIGEKMYELSDYLGNVKAVITDRKKVQEQVDNPFDDLQFGTPCVAPGDWFFSSGTSHSLADVNGDGATDLVSSHTSNYYLSLNINTVVSETYTVSYDILEQTATGVYGRGKTCPGAGAVLGMHNALGPGSYSYSFVATTTNSKVMWFVQGIPVDGGGCTLSNLHIEGAGDPMGSGSAEPLLALLPDVVSYSDYYPYGMQMPGRKGSVADYRYGVNGQEMDDELKGEGNSANFQFRMYDPRLSRFYAVDPIAAEYAELTPYQYAANNPIVNIESKGLEGVSVHHIPPPNYYGVGIVINLGGKSVVEQVRITVGAQYVVSLEEMEEVLASEPEDTPTPEGTIFELAFADANDISPSKIKLKPGFKAGIKGTAKVYPGFKFSFETKSEVSLATSKADGALTFKYNSSNGIGFTQSVGPPTAELDDDEYNPYKKKKVNKATGTFDSTVSPAKFKKEKGYQKESSGSSLANSSADDYHSFSGPSNFEYGQTPSLIFLSDGTALPGKLEVNIDVSLPGLSVPSGGPSIKLQTAQIEKLKFPLLPIPSTGSEVESEESNPPTPLLEPSARPEGVSGPLQEDGTF